MRKISVREFGKNSIAVFFYNHGKIRKNEVFVNPCRDGEISENMIEAIKRIPRDMKICIVYREKRALALEQLKGMAIEISWVKHGSFSYYKSISESRYIIGEEYIGSNWTKKEGQLYFKLEDRDSVSKYSREELKSYEGRCRQIDCYQVDYFLCEDYETAEHLKTVEILKDFCMAKIVILNSNKIDWKNASTFSYNGKENVLLYGSALEQNGLTSSLLNMFQKIDLKEKNYWICGKFPDKSVKMEVIDSLPKDIGLKGMEISYTLGEFFAEICVYKLNINVKILKLILEKMYQREYRRNFLPMRIHTMVQFTGYEADMIHLFSKADTKKIIYVHSDMESEIRLRRSQHLETLEKAYRMYDIVTVVNDKLLEGTKRIGGNASNYKVVNNFFDDSNVKKRAEKDLKFDKETVSTHSVEEIKDILESKAEKFITIGRFSKEKGHFMLLEAFREYVSQHDDTYLFIVGGRGELYDKTIKYVEKLQLNRNVILIKSMRNPMPLLKKCDLFILSSLYEGFGLVVLEAAALQVPVVTTDIIGPAKFVKEHGGTVVACSKNGIKKGMDLYAEKKVKTMDIDFQAYNNVCKEQLNEVL